MLEYKERRCGVKRYTYIFPIIIIILNVGAAVMYGAAHNWRQAVYFAAAAILNAAVTF